MIYRSNKPAEGVDSFDEESAKETGLYVPNGPELAKMFMEK